VQIHIVGKPRGASVIASNEGLADAGAVERRRAQWRAALDALKAYLIGSSGRA
jgi:hypothetical protein